MVLRFQAGDNVACVWDVATGTPHRLIGTPRPPTPLGMCVRRAYWPKLPALVFQAADDGAYRAVLPTFQKIGVYDLEAAGPRGHSLRSAVKTG
jgi:hypothetical protein